MKARTRESKQLHSDTKYLHLAIFIGSITTIHLLSHLVSQSTPQILKYIMEPSHNSPLNHLYNGGWSITYLFRNLSLAFSIYPAVLFTFLFDHYKKEGWLKWVNWKTILIFLVSITTIITILGKPRLDTTYNLAIFLNLRFETGGNVYLFAIITWILLIVLSFKILHDKMPKHHALWLALLVFLSCQEVWEYAPYIWAHLVNPQPITVPANLLMSLHTWRAMPSILLICYAYKFGFNTHKKYFVASFFISVTSSLLLIFYTALYPISPFLRVTWAVTYLLFAVSLNCKAEVKESNCLNEKLSCLPSVW